ncbi:MAG TPA: hypothetical protein VGN23_15675 [Verrucomicrobiae bacterium]|jgi:hypothetical protein
MILQTMQKVALLAALILACSFSAVAQSYSIDWYKISGGGGASTNGAYSLTGTIGQPDAGMTMSGGNYSVTGGFWSLISVVQTVGAPPLYISHSGNNVTVYWQAAGSWTLKQTTTLSSSPAWSPYNPSPNLINGTNYVTITSPTGNLFFQLQ